jgi:hypothetical protein
VAAGGAHLKKLVLREGFGAAVSAEDGAAVAKVGHCQAAVSLDGDDTRRARAVRLRTQVVLMALTHGTPERATRILAEIGPREDGANRRVRKGGACVARVPVKHASEALATWQTDRGCTVLL